MRNRRNKRWLLSWALLWAHLVLAEETNLTNDNLSRGIFSPRMDYDQWKPLGRGDPLKNDPTYDYVPPVLDRVHYWIEPTIHNPEPDGKKTEVLLLGVSSKKSSTPPVADSRKDTYDQFLKFVDGPKFNNQRGNRPHFSNYYTKNKKSDQRVPYTILRPPPIVTKSPIQPITLQQLTTNSPTTSTSPPTVTVQEANLIYQSSSTNEWKTTETSITPELLFPQHLQPPESYIQIQLAPTQDTLTNKPLIGANSNQNINYVTPPPLEATEVMHKGQVSDGNLDISNTYVKIGKTEAQVLDSESSVLPPQMLMGPPPPPMMVFPRIKPMITQTTLKQLETMQPPPVTTSPIFKKTTNPILEALKKEKVQEESTTEETTPAPTSLTTDSLFKHYKQPAEALKGPLYLIIQGHSKVKTYGPSKQFHGIRVQQETNEISDEDHEEKERPRQGRSRNLQTLKHVIETGFGAIDFSEDSVKEAEVQFGYEVGGENATTAKYHKGIVEAARKLNL